MGVVEHSCELQPDQSRHFFPSSLADAINLPETSGKASPIQHTQTHTGGADRQADQPHLPQSPAPPTTTAAAESRVSSSRRRRRRSIPPPRRVLLPRSGRQISRGDTRIWGFSRGGGGRSRRRWRSRGCGGSRSSLATYATATTRSRSTSASTRSSATSARGSKTRRSHPCSPPSPLNFWFHAGC